MTTLRYTLITACIALVSLSIAGCFEIEEKYTFHKDGSATMVYEFNMGSQLLQLMGAEGKDPVKEMRTKFEEGRAKIKALKNVRSVELIDKKDGDGHRIGFKMVVNDVTQLQTTLKEVDAVMEKVGDDKDEPADAPAKDLNKVTVTRDGDVIRFRRLVAMDTGNEQDNAAQDEGMKKMFNAAFAGKHYIVRLYTDNVVETNGEVNDDEGYIEWKKPMIDMMGAKGPWELTATLGPAGAGGGMMIWIIIGVVAVLAVLIIVIVISKSKQTAA